MFLTLRRTSPGVRIGSAILCCSRRGPEIAAALPRRRNNAAIVPAIGERESDFGSSQVVNLEHRAPRRDVVALGADDENGQPNVLQGDPAAVELEAALGEVVLQKERAQILAVHPVMSDGQAEMSSALSGSPIR